MKIVIIADNKDRELSYLRQVKLALEKSRKIKTHIIGSVANKQKILYKLYKLKPTAVLISQVIEDSMREVAK